MDFFHPQSDYGDLTVCISEISEIIIQWILIHQSLNIERVWPYSLRFTLVEGVERLEPALFRSNSSPSWKVSLYNQTIQFHCFKSACSEIFPHFQQLKLKLPMFPHVPSGFSPWFSHGFPGKPDLVTCAAQLQRFEAVGQQPDHALAALHGRAQQRRGHGGDRGAELGEGAAETICRSWDELFIIMGMGIDWSHGFINNNGNNNGNY